MSGGLYMKKILSNICITAALLVSLASCNTDAEYVKYSGPNYIMFSDTLYELPVQSNGEVFEIPVVATCACDYDRTLAVEIVDSKSNATEGRHYALKSNTITIKAGELVGNVEVLGYHDNIEVSDSIGFSLRLVTSEDAKWDLYGTDTNVWLKKACTFDINAFTGYCFIISTFINNYVQTTDGRLTYSVVDPENENTIIMKDYFYDGYDVTITFNPEDPAHPLVTMDSNQVLSDEASVLGWILGDNHILAEHSPYYDSYFNSCQRFVELWMHVYVEKVGENIGTIGHFYNILEWVSDEEADRLQREDGM